MTDPVSELGALWDRRIAEVLAEHLAVHPGSPLCRCGWSPPLKLNDTGADRAQHIAHQAAKVREALLAGADDITEVTKWVGNGDDPWSETRRVVRVGWAVPDA